MGAITGLSFSLVYTLAALPIARLADRYSPKLVIIICLVLWNALTTLCGLANGFLALACLRMGVAIGEAGCGPATQSLLANHFPPNQRGRAIALWQMVFPLGTLVGIFGSGMLSSVFGWRNTFFVLGALGMLVAPLIMLFLVDRKRPEAAVESAQTPASGTIVNALGEILASRAYRLLLLAGFLGAIPLSAMLNWNAPFYGRIFSLPIEDITYIVALTAGIGGALGMFGGGFVSDFLGRKDSRWYCWMPALAMAVAPLFMLYQYGFAPSAAMSLPAGIVGAILLNCWIPPQAAIGQLVVRQGNRALSAACILVAAGLGSALGPFITGLLSDIVAVRLGDPQMALTYALPIVSLTALPAAVLFLMSGIYLREDLAAFEAAQSNDPESGLDHHRDPATLT